jgi:hypothetical protein
LPGKGSEGSSREAAWGRRVLGVEGVNELLRVSKVVSWFPTVVARIIAFPFNKILILITVLTTVENILDFIFKFVIDLDWFRGWWRMSVDFVAMPRGEAVNMEDRMLVHGRRKL